MALTDWQRGFARLITAGASQGLGSEVRAQALADLPLLDEIKAAASKAFTNPRSSKVAV